MVFQNWVKSIQAAAYNGARTVYVIEYCIVECYCIHRNSKLFFHPAKFDNFKDEKISECKTVSVSQSKNLLD